MPEQFLSPGWLSYLCEWGEVAVHEAGNEEIHETMGIDEGAWARNTHRLEWSVAPFRSYRSRNHNNSPDTTPIHPYVHNRHT